MPRCVTASRSACPPTSAARSPTSPRSTRRPASSSLGKTLTTPERLVTGIENGVGKAGSRFQAARLFLHGTTVAINTILERKRRALRAAHHAGLPRHLRDRPRQPAGVLQPVLREARAADRPRPALRDHGADRRAGHGADPARRGAGARSSRARRSAQGVQAIAILFLHSYRNPAHEQRAKAIVRAANSRSSSSPPRTS